MSTLQSTGKRVIGSQLLEEFEKPPYGWDPNAVRVGVAALVRAGAVKVLINKKPYTNPADRELVDALRVSRSFAKAELVLEDTEIPSEVLTETRSFLIQLAKKRGIDETPAALSEEAGKLAEIILEKADSVSLWASGSQMPLSEDFTEGEEAWRKVVALTTPAHRVREVHASRDVLQKGTAAIEAHAEFQAKQGAQFTELKNFCGQLTAIEYRLDGADASRTLLETYRRVSDSRSFSEKDSWKTLQNLKAQATVELTSLLDAWRKEAHEQLTGALDRLPQELALQNLLGGLTEELGKPLVALRDSLDMETVPVAVSNLPARAADAVRQLGVRIQQEIAKKAAPPPSAGVGGRQEPPEQPGASEPKPQPPSKQIRKLRLQDVALVTVIHDVREWDTFRDRLDERVRKLIRDGYDVDLG